MLKENWRLIARLERFGDYLIIVLAFFAAYYGRDSLVFWNRALNLEVPFEAGGLAPISEYIVALVVALVGYTIVLNFLDAYSSMRMSSSFRLLRISIFSSLVVFLLLAATLFLLKLQLSRSFITLFCVLVGLSLTAERYCVLAILRFWRRRGRNFRNVLVCGVGEQALALAREIARRPELGILIRGFVDLQTEPNLEMHQLFRQKLRILFSGKIARILLGGQSLARALKEYAVDEVIFTDVLDVLPVVEEMILVSSEQGVRTTLAADLFSIGMVKSGLSYFGDMPLIHFQTPPGDRWELTVKRWVDIVVSGLMLLILSPLLLLIALMIRISSPGPIIFSQKRVGLNGRLFSLYKFRSMYNGAESELAQLKTQNEMSGPAFKMKDDPRVTPFGRLLRRFSLDELPQLVNVFVGDMSLVGPRPPVPGEVSLYERRDRRRLSMRPGITCTWQVSGRNEISDFQDWVKLDLDYIDNWSLSRDLLLLFRTIPAVIFGTGAR